MLLLFFLHSTTTTTTITTRRFLFLLFFVILWTSSNSNSINNNLGLFVSCFTMDNNNSHSNSNMNNNIDSSSGSNNNSILNLNQSKHEHEHEHHGHGHGHEHEQQQKLTKERKEEILYNLDKLYQRSKSFSSPSPSSSSSSSWLSHEEQLQILRELQDCLRSKSWKYVDDDETVEYGDYECALLKLKILPSLSSFSSLPSSSSELDSSAEPEVGAPESGSTGADANVNDNADINTYKRLSEMGIIYMCSGLLDVYTKRLEYEMKMKMKMELELEMESSKGKHQYQHQHQHQHDKKHKHAAVRVPKFVQNVSPLITSSSTSTSSTITSSTSTSTITSTASPETTSNFNIHGPSSMPFLLDKFEVWTTCTNNTSRNTESLDSTDGDVDVDVDVDVGTSTKIMIGDKNHDKTTDKNEEGVNLVLGAGNQSNISIIDILHSIFIHPRKPILFKHHPLRSKFLQRPFNQLLQPLIARNLLYTIDDYGIEFTQELLQRTEITNVHLTGALSTSRAITESYAKTRPHLSKEMIQSRITSELGCVTPCIITPEKYSPFQLHNCVTHIVTSKKMFAGSNCLGLQVIVVSHSWKQKEEFKRVLVEQMSLTPTDPSYYPKSLDRVRKFVEEYTNLNSYSNSNSNSYSNSKRDNNGNLDSDSSRKRVFQVRGSRVTGCGGQNGADDVQVQAPGAESESVSLLTSSSHPYIIECGLYGTDEYNDYALRNEAFGPILAIVELADNLMLPNKDDCEDQLSKEGGSGEGSPNRDGGIEFLVNSAVPFVNNKENIFGSLSCMLMYPLPTFFNFFRNREYQMKMKRDVISKLSYGTVAVNTNSYMGYFALAFGAQWGAHPRDHQGQSGNGYIGNGYGLKNVDKSVIYGRSLSFPLILFQKRFMLPSFAINILNNVILFKSRFKLPFRFFR